MFKFEHSLYLDVPKNELFKILTDYTKLKQLLPDQVKTIKIISESDIQTITEEHLIFNTYFKNQKIIQQTSHEIITDEKIINTVVEGPFKNSSLEIHLKSQNNGTQINLIGACKIPIKYFILTNVIKKYYKAFSIAVFYKIQNFYNSYS
tara:strand:- start:9156 stop:9602 length:447 start_codon:yes stop_codon:yes gene_type:complete